VAIAQPPVTSGNLQGIGRAQNREAPVPQGGMTPLLYAARDGRLEIARMLVAAGAQVHTAEANGTTPLLVAIVNGQIGVARFLMEQGADVNASDGFGRTPLWSAVDLRNLDLDGSGKNGVDRAAALDLIQALLARGANVNARTRVEPPSRRWMIPFGARVWVDTSGQTPFVRAALAGDVTVMRMLLDRGADPKIATNGGVTALMAAAGVGWVPLQTYTESPANLLEAVKLAASLNVDVNAADSKGYTAIHGAAYRGSDAIVQFLAGRGARLDAKDKAGRTPAALADGTAYLGGTPLERKASTIALIETLSAGGKTQQ
jgi:ankyrin repeat protein